jgi:hypothetical protein
MEEMVLVACMVDSGWLHGCKKAPTGCMFGNVDFGRMVASCSGDVVAQELRVFFKFGLYLLNKESNH